MIKLADSEIAEANNILREVSEESGVSLEEIKSKDNVKQLVLVRRYAYQRLRSELNLTTGKIGKLCNRSDDSIRRSLLVGSRNTVEGTEPARPKPAVVKYIKIEAWISIEDAERLTELAQRNNVTLSDMVRGVLVDAICEEFP